MEPLRPIKELLKDASAATQPDEAWRFLSEALNQAATWAAWRLILGQIPPGLSVERQEEVLCQALSWARAHEECWAYRLVAIHQASHLHDAAAAQATLAEGEALLSRMERADRLWGYEWGILAEAHALCGQPLAETRRCLEQGWSVAWRHGSIEMLGRLTAKWALLLGAEEGVARMRDVEQLARGQGSMGDTVYWWHALGLPGEALRAFRVATEVASRRTTSCATGRNIRGRPKRRPGTYRLSPHPVS